MRTIIIQIIMSGIVSLSYLPVANAVGFFIKPCNEKICLNTAAREKFESCIEKEETSIENGTADHFHGCPNELNEYAKTVVDLKKCIDNTRMVESRK